MKKIGIFYENPFRAGGTETWILNICLVYGEKYDITIYYPYNLHIGENVPKGSYDRLARIVKLVPVSTEIVHCDVALFAFDYFHLPLVEAKEKYLFIHPGDGHGNHPRSVSGYSDFTGVIGVSQYTVNKMKKWCPKLHVIKLYNPVPEQELRFISMSRSAKDKGWNRMKRLAKEMSDMGIKFRWDVYTDYHGVVDCPYMKFHKPTIHAIDKIRESDFLVQLSDHESFGYSMVEGMQYSKLIVSDIEILPEMGINSKNAVIVPLHNINYKDVVMDILSRTYIPPINNDNDECTYESIFGEPCDNKHKRIKVKNITDMDWLVEDQDCWVEEGKTSFIYDTPNARKLINLNRLKEI